MFPAWGLGKLAVHVDLRMDHQGQRGRQLLRHELEPIVSAPISAAARS
jgi:hypothetical protein